MALKYTSTKTLRSHYPWTSTPLITSAPMRLISTPLLAIAVSRAGGLGFIAAGTDCSLIPSHLQDTVTTLQSSPIPNTPPGILPIGVGFICWGADLSTAVSAILETPLKPAAAWLFAPRELQDLTLWVDEIRKASNGKTKIWVQVGTVQMAIEATKVCRPDVLVIQGSDAGGHGLAQSSSIISLLPECADALESTGLDLPLMAAGGIMDGRGVAATLMLGASGVSMGTRFLASSEAVISDGYKNAVVKARDGGVNTARTTVYDKLRGTVGWPESYNARGVLNQSFWDHENGMSDSENKRLYEEAMRLGDAGWGDRGRMTTYAGTGIGLVHEVMAAKDIIREVLIGAKSSIVEAKSVL